ncbi:MAG: ABC transporter permease [Chloroflexi bacterium]|nr:ABC transporter permease [Chloroflexota bacterium]
MSAQPQVALPQLGAPSRLKSSFTGFGRFMRKNPTGAVGLFMVLVMVVLASNWILLRFGVGILQRYDPVDQDSLIRLTGPSLTHFFGTDEFGRDLYSRIVGGASISLLISFSCVGIGSVSGLFLGIMSGYFGGVIDDLFQRGVEVMISMPGLLLALAIMSTLGPGIDKVIIAITVSIIPRALRNMRASTLSVKQNVYVEAARAIGSSQRRIMFRHILPNVMAPFLIIASASLGGAILQESTLSFLGLGVPPPHPSWGRMLSSGAQTYAISAPWMVIFPGIAITWLVLGFNLFGDALRDIWDPRLRGSQ